MPSRRISKPSRGVLTTFGNKCFVKQNICQNSPTWNWHYVYVLYSERDRDFYIGYTQDLRRRIQEHNAKMNFSTKSRIPLFLIYAEACSNEEDARRREDYLKTTQGRRFLKLRLRKFIKSLE